MQENVIKWKESGKDIYFYLSNDNEIKKIREFFTNVNIIKKKINHGFIIGKYVIISEFDIDNIKNDLAIEGMEITNADVDMYRRFANDELNMPQLIEIIKNQSL